MAKKRTEKLRPVDAPRTEAEKRQRPAPESTDDFGATDTDDLTDDRIVSLVKVADRDVKVPDAVAKSRTANTSSSADRTNTDSKAEGHGGKMTVLSHVLSPGVSMLVVAIPILLVVCVVLYFVIFPKTIDAEKIHAILPQLISIIVAAILASLPHFHQFCSKYFEKQAIGKIK
jgi:hypothetical protein